MQTQKEKKHSESETMAWDANDWDFYKKAIILIAIIVGLHYFAGDQLNAQNPIIQFIIGTLFFYAIVPIIISRSQKWGGWNSFVNTKVLGSIALLGALDLVSYPPFVDTNGVFTGENVFLAKGTIDYMVYLFFSALHISGSMMFFAVYVVGTLALFAIGLYLLTEAQLNSFIS